MTTEIVPVAQTAEQTGPLLDGGQGLMVSMAALVLIGVVVMVIMLS